MKDIQGGETKVMKKSLSILLALAMVLTAFSGMAFAADDTITTEEKFKHLKEKGIFNGINEAGDPAVEELMTRAQFAKVAGLLEGLDVKADFATPTFSDVAEDAWYYNYVEAAAAAGLVEGIGEGKFDPEANVTLEQMGKVFVLMLGLDVDEDAEVEGASDWANGFVAAALEAHLFPEMNDYNVNATRGQLMDASFEVAIDKGMIEDPRTPDELEVVSVEVLNLKQVEVKFNNELENAGNDNNYKIDGGSADLSTSTKDSRYDLQEDGMTVVITMAVAADQQDSIDFEISDLKDVDGNTLETVEVEGVEFKDTTFPELVDVDAIGSNTFKATFSEPIETFEKNDITVKKGNTKYHVKEVTPASTLMNEYLIVTYNKLTEDEFTLSFGSGIEDFAGLGVDKQTKSVEVTIDEEAPVVIDYKDVTTYGATLVFNEPIKLNSNDKTDFYHTNSKNVVDSIDADDVDGNELKLDFTTNNLGEGTATVIIKADSLEDFWGNENDKVSEQIVVEIDKTAPELKEIKSGDNESEIVLVYTEDMDKDSTEDVDNYTLLDEDGDELKNYIIDADLTDDKATITFKKALSGDHTIVIEDVEDRSGNEIEKTSSDFNVDDLTDPKLAETTVTLYYENTDNQILKVAFKEEMTTEGKYSVLDLEKYTYIANNGDETNFSKIDDLEAELTDGGKSVEFTVELSDFKFDETDEIEIARVADVSGNFTEASDVIDIDGPKGSFKLENAELVGKDEVKLYVDGTLIDVDYREFGVMGAGNYFEVVDQDLDPDATNTVVILKLKEDSLGTSVTGNVYGKTFMGNDSDFDSYGMYGIKLADSDFALVDKAAPVVTSAVFNTDKTTITLTFSENLDNTFSTTNNNGFSLTRGDIGSVSFDGSNKVTLTAAMDDQNNYIPFNKSVEVSYNEAFGIQDAQDNEVKSFDDLEVDVVTNP